MFVADDMIVYIENPKKSTENWNYSKVKDTVLIYES